MAARLTTFVVVAIVAVTLIAGLIVGAQRDDNDGPVDLIVHNARVYTATEKQTMAEAIAIRGSQILRVGSEKEIVRLKRPQTTMIDAEGAAVVPGFNDAEVDFLEGGASLERIGLTDAATPRDIERRISDWAAANPGPAWVLGRGWRRDTFTDGPPTRQMLDRIVPDRPARMVSADGQTAWVNSKALELAKIERRTGNPATAGVAWDARTGEPTGLLQGTAAAIVEGLLPPLTAAERDRAIRSATDEAHRHGVTSVQAVSDGQELAAYAEARRKGELRVRVYSALPVDGDLTDEQIDRLHQTAARYPDDPLLKAGALHLMLDDGSSAGSVPSDAAPSAERLRYDPDAFNRLVRRLDARGWQIITEAARAKAVTMTLDAYQHAARSNTERTRERRHRIRNVRRVGDEDLARFAPLGTIASIRPLPDEPMSGRSPETAMRAPVIPPGRLALGSGWPSSPIDPLLGLSGLTTPSPGVGTRTDPQIPLQSAIDAYTSRAAWASFDEQRKGTIAPGMLADIVVLSDDIFKMPPATVPEARVEVTIFDGKVVYRRAQHAPNLVRRNLEP
jgi:hypothetical protein